MIKFNLKDDFKLIMLCAIVFLCCLIKYYIPSLTNVQFLFLLLHVGIILFAREDELIPIIMFNHTCSALYDDIGFKYIFNLTILIAIIKILIKKDLRINKTIFSLFCILMLYELLLTFINIGISTQSLNLVTFISSYLFIILIISMKDEKYININKIYKYFFFGFLISGISGYMYPISKWGSKIPITYRFKGLLRDSNYYSVDALLLIISSMLYNKKITKEALIMFVVGILAVSKMFILISLISFFIMAFWQIMHIKNKKQMLCLMVVLLSLPLVFYNLKKLSFVDNMINKYLYRTESVSLLTGREYIQEYYINTLYNDPITLIFGRSTSYSEVLDIGHDIGDSFYYNIVAHNTYLDVILSWGVLGIIIYAFLVLRLFFTYKRNYNIKNKFNALFLVLIGMCLFALSYLMLDFFAIMILYIMIFSYNRGEKYVD